MKIVYPPTLGWDFLFQRPQQLARAFAQLGHQFYFAQHPAVPGMQQVQEVEPNLFLINNKFEDWLLSNGDYVIFSSWAKHHNLKKLVGNRCKLFVYDCLDDFPQWQDLEQEMFREAELVIASADKNYQRAIKKTLVPVITAYNAANLDDFSKSLYPGPNPMHSLLPEGIRAVFTGCVGDWVDHKIVTAAATHRPDIQFIFVGHIWNQSARQTFPKFNNIHIFSSIPHRELASLFSCMDVGLLPFLTNNRVTEAADPIKIWEYLAGGLPVVATPIHEVLKFGDFVRVADNGAAFADAIAEEAHKAPRVAERREFLKGNQWIDRAKVIEKYMVECLEAK